MGQLRSDRALIVILALLVACTRGEDTELRSRPHFGSTILTMCARVEAATDATEKATTATEFQDRSRELLEEQERFFQGARRLSPPTESRAAFEAYLVAIERLVSLNRRSLQGFNDRRESLLLALDAAETGVRALNAKEQAHLPSSCPPASALEVDVFLFVARGNVACFNLGSELEQLGKLQAEADTRKETAELFEFAEALALSLATALRESVPDQLDEPTVQRVIGLYEERAKALEALHEAFATRDRTAYDRAARKQERAARMADRLADAIGLTECTGFLGISAE